MQIIGKIKHIGETVAVSDKFKKREIVITIDEETKYPQHITFQVSQDKCDKLNGLQIGYELNVSFNLKGREWNGKYFNTLEMWSWAITNASVNDNSAETAAQLPPKPKAKIIIDEINDLPF
jgi:hypothetical protein